MGSKGVFTATSHLFFTVVIFTSIQDEMQAQDFEDRFLLAFGKPGRYCIMACREIENTFYLSTQNFTIILEIDTSKDNRHTQLLFATGIEGGISNHQFLKYQPLVTSRLIFQD